MAVRFLDCLAPGGLDKAIDRPKEQPSLAAMTETAIEKLKSNEEGFFLMVEGSQIDWAGHDNDVVAAMSEIEDFEGAFEKVLAFAEEDGRTLVVTTADHSTGGFSLGEGGPYQWDPDVIRAASHTPDYMAGQIVKEGADVKKTLTDAIDFELTGEEIASVQEAVNKGNEEESFAAVDNAIEAIFNKRSGTGWTTDGHTGVDVPVYAYGPASERFSGFMDNTDNAEIIFELLNGSEGEEGAPLADTATSYPLGMLMGAIVAGAGVILFMRRKQVKA